MASAGPERDTRTLPSGYPFDGAAPSRTGYCNEAVHLPALRPAALFREYALRALRPCAGLSARRRHPERAGARRRAVARARRCRGEALPACARTPPTAPATGMVRGRFADAILHRMPAQPHDPGPLGRRECRAAGASCSPPSAGCSTRSSSSALPIRPRTRTRTRARLRFPGATRPAPRPMRPR